MWYEILPGFALMTICMIIPGAATVHIHKFTNGGKQKRLARTRWQWYMMERDRRVSEKGEYHHSKGLENIN